MRQINKLKDRFVSSVARVGRYGNGQGLYLQVSEIDGQISKSWVYRFMLNGKARTMGLGAVGAFTIKEARERARKARQLTSDGVDPINLRQSERGARIAAEAKTRADAMTFRDAAGDYLKNHEATWKSAKHAALWKSSVESYAYPVIGDLPVESIELAHIVKILQPIWLEKLETASRIRERIESVLDYAFTVKELNKPNPARWRGNLENLFPKKTKVRKVEHHPSMPFEDLPAFMIELRKQQGMDAKALEFCILTATRSSETLLATWNEIDLKARTWTIPAERMKADAAHTVPLTDRAVALLESLPKVNSFVFPGSHGRHLWADAMRVLLRKLVKGCDVHGFRSSFVTWASERTHYPEEIREACLAHAIKNKTRAAYQRGTLFDKRERLMDEWSRYCLSKPVAGEVVSLRRA